MLGTDSQRSVRGRILPFPQDRSEPLTIVPPNARPGDELIFFTVNEPHGAEMLKGDVIVAKTNFNLDDITEDTLCLVDDGREVLPRRPRDLRHANLKAVNKLAPPPPPQKLFKQWEVMGIVLAIVRPFS